MNAAVSGCSLSPLVARRPVVRGLMLTLALSVGFTVPALGDVRILASNGGAVGDYLNFFEKVRQSGERVVMSHTCARLLREYRLETESSEKDGCQILKIPWRYRIDEL